MVSFCELDGDRELSQAIQEQEWVILGNSSDVSLLPATFQVDNPHVSFGALQNCQGGALQTAGIRKAELITTTSDGEEIQHESIVGNVTSCLVSLDTLSRAIEKEDGTLQLQSPGNEIRILVEFKNRSFAIKAHVRQIIDCGQCVALECIEELVVRTVVYGDEIENEPLGEWRLDAVHEETDHQQNRIALLAIQNHIDPEVPEGENLDRC